MIKAKKYRKKPVVIDAILYDGSNSKEVRDFTNGMARKNTGQPHMIITTLEGDIRAAVGDYIIKGIKGGYYPCKPDIFEATYEPA